MCNTVLPNKRDLLLCLRKACKRIQTHNVKNYFERKITFFNLSRPWIVFDKMSLHAQPQAFDESCVTRKKNLDSVVYNSNFEEDMMCDGQVRRLTSRWNELKKTVELTTSKVKGLTVQAQIRT